MKRKNTLASMAVAAVFSSAAPSIAQTTVDFGSATCYGLTSNSVMVENIRLLTPIINPFDPGSTTVATSSYNIPFSFDMSTLHLVPNLGNAAQTDNGTGTSASNCAALEVVVADAFTGQPISGATVTVGGRNVTSNSSGVASLSGLTAGTAQVSAVASNFASASQTLNELSCSRTNSASIALSPTSGAGALTTNEFRVVLTWGENPYDLDSHMTGPLDGAVSDSNRFHTYFAARTDDVAALDVDDTSSFGPETITVSPPSGSSTLRPGVYRYSVHHWGGNGNIGTSGANVRLTLANGTTYNYTPVSLPGFSTSNDVWTVFELTVASNGTVYVAPVDSVSSSSSYSVRSASQSHSGYGKPEARSIFQNLTK